MHRPRQSRVLTRCPCSLSFLSLLPPSEQQGINVENVQFSDSVLKVNKREKQQKRDLVITTSSIYNFKEKSYKAAQRAIQIINLRGVVLCSKSDEVLLQVKNEYDYRLLIVRQADAIRILAELYELLTGGAKLNVEIVEDLNLVQVLKADVKKGGAAAAGGEEDEDGLVAAGAGASGHGHGHARSNSDFSSPATSPVGTSAAAQAALADLKPSMEGWLTKKGQVNLVWRRRYFRLAESNLLYYEARLKGTIELVAGGEARAWVNKRLSMQGAEASASSSSSASSAQGTLAPLLYEFKLSSSYGITPERHLKDILSDEDRCRSFVKFCESLQAKPSKLKQLQQPTNAAEGAATAAATAPRGSKDKLGDESGNAKFYRDVEKYKALWSPAAAASAPTAASHAAAAASSPASPASPGAVSSSASASYEQLLAEAKRIYEQYVVNGAPTPINAPSAVREAVGDLLARQKLAPNPFAAAALRPAPLHPAPSPSPPLSAGQSGAFPAPSAPLGPPPSSASLSADLFNLCQSFSVDHMQSEVLPLYLLHSQASLKSIVDDFRLKTDLTEADKKVSSCFSCLSSFGIMKRRNFCRYCCDVFCNACLTKSCTLPPEYKLSDPIKVCDLCYGTLEISLSHPHAFSYVNKTRNRPINLAASSPQELNAWIGAIRKCIQARSNPSAAAAPAPDYSGMLMKEDPTTKIWRRRYFILNGSSGHLYYYELNLKGSLSLAQGAGVHSTTAAPTLSAADSSFGGVASQSDFAQRFNISYNNRLYALSADSVEQMERWMEALQKAIRRQKPGAQMGAHVGVGGGLSALLQTQALSAPGGAHNRRPSAMMTPANAGLGSPTAAGAVSSTPSSAAEQYSSSFAQRAPEGEVTFVFTDVQNSTKLWELAADGMNKALERHDSLLRMLLQVYKGYEVKTEGDAFMVTFFNPFDAVRWCLACQTALLENVWPEDVLAQPSGKQEWRNGQMVFNGIRIRMGIHFGHPACRRNPITGRMDYFGPVVNRSARVSDSAHGGQVVCTAEVADRLTAGIAAGEFPTSTLHLKDLGFHRYKGITELVQVFQISNDALSGRNPFPELRTTKADEAPEGAGESEKVGEGGATAVAAAAASSSSAASASTSPDSVSPPGAHLSPPMGGGNLGLPEGLVYPAGHRPSHLTVPSISALSIHPYTPSAAAQAAAPARDGTSSVPPRSSSTEVDSDLSDAGSSSDEEADEDERVERQAAKRSSIVHTAAATAALAAASTEQQTLTPDAATGSSMSPSPAGSPSS